MNSQIKSHPCAEPGDIIKVINPDKSETLYLICEVRSTPDPDTVTYRVFADGKVTSIHNAKPFRKNHDSIIPLANQQNTL